MNKVYTRINWENYPSENTAVNESNLNRMDYALDEIDKRVVEHDTTKANVASLNNLIDNWVIDETTGVITIHKVSGEQIIFDLNLEKVPVGFSMTEDGILIMTTDDGTEFTANIGSMIPILTFNDSEQIAVSVSGEGVNKNYTFTIKTGSITEDKLQPNFLADCRLYAGNAENSATLAEEYAQQAKESAESISNNAGDISFDDTNAQTGSDNVQGAIDSVNNSLKNSTQIEMFTSTGSNVVPPFSSLNSYITIYGARCGKVVTLYIYITGGNMTVNSNTVIGQLSKWKPVIPVANAMVEGSTVGKIALDTNGSLRAIVQSATAYYSTTLVYITRDF